MEGVLTPNNAEILGLPPCLLLRIVGLGASRLYELNLLFSQSRDSLQRFEGAGMWNPGRRQTFRKGYPWARPHLGRPLAQVHSAGIDPIAHGRYNQRSWLRLGCA